MDTQKNLANLDRTLIWIVLFLLGTGLVMVYSASIAIAEAKGSAGGSGHYLIRHAAYVAIGLLLGFIAFQVPMKMWQKYSTHLFLFGTFLLILVLVPGIGREANSSHRWLSLSGIGVDINFQPSELMKFLAVVYAADYVARRAAYLDNLRKGLMPILFVMTMASTLLLLEPDFGAFFVITMLVVVILFLGGVQLRLFAGLIALLLTGLILLIWFEPYRMSRIIAFMDPWADPLGAGYQLIHALIAFGRGEWLGVGLGASVEKLFYLPEAHTDFLLAVLAEELGFAGVITVIILFAWLIVRAFMIGRQAVRFKCYFSALVAQGIGAWIGIQAFINMGVNMGVLPTKGLTLPLIGFGGSSIAVICIALAVLLRIDWENRQLSRGVAT